MNKFYLSISTSDEVDELYANEQVEAAEISSSRTTLFELTDKQALDLYHFVRQCLLLENTVTIVVANKDGSLIRREESLQKVIDRAEMTELINQPKN